MGMQVVRTVVLATVVCAGVIAAGVSPAAAVVPVVSSFSPASGTIGTTVTITGSGFTGATTVTFDQAAARFHVRSASKITATVPAAASTGPIAVTGPGGAASSAKSFTVTPGVALSVRSGPPTSTVRVSGAGFGASRTVDIYFDTTHEAVARTSGTGTFSGTAIAVPASAVPGKHHITAVERHSGSKAQALFLVRTNWAQYHYSSSRTGLNPYENVLSPSNVATMGLDWSFTANDGVSSSPAVANGVVYIGSGDNKMYALNATTGARLWNFTTDSTVYASPAVANGLVYTGTYNGTVYAFDLPRKTSGTNRPTVGQAGFAR